MTLDVQQRIHAALEDIVARTDVAMRVENDPVGLVRPFPATEREVVAHIAAPLAYGAVASIRRAIQQVLEVLGESPTDWVRHARRGDFLRARPDFVYRMTRADDVDAYLAALGALLREHGRLESAFLRGWHTSDADVSAALGTYVHKIRAAGGSTSRGFYYLTPDPRKGGATKRWHLMLRWLVRPDDGVDTGLWSSLPTRQLLLPVDRHIEGIVRSLGWVERSTVDLRFVREATAMLRRFDAEDPMRYDFALCHLGISRDCLHRWDENICPKCPLLTHCMHTVTARALDPSLGAFPPIR